MAQVLINAIIPKELVAEFFQHIHDFDGDKSKIHLNMVLVSSDVPEFPAQPEKS